MQRKHNKIYCNLRLKGEVLHYLKSLVTSFANYDSNTFPILSWFIYDDRKRQRMLSLLNVDLSDLSERLKTIIQKIKTGTEFWAYLLMLTLNASHLYHVFNPLKVKDKLKPPKKQRYPPIFVYNVNIKALVDTLRLIITEYSFKIKNFNKNKSKLYFEDPSVHANFFFEPDELTLEQEINIFMSDYKNISKTDSKCEFLRLLNKIKSNYEP